MADKYITRNRQWRGKPITISWKGQEGLPEREHLIRETNSAPGANHTDMRWKSRPERAVRGQAPGKV